MRHIAANILHWVKIIMIRAYRYLVADLICPGSARAVVSRNTSVPVYEGGGDTIPRRQLPASLVSHYHGSFWTQLGQYFGFYPGSIFQPSSQVLVLAVWYSLIRWYGGEVRRSRK